MTRETESGIKTYRNTLETDIAINGLSNPKFLLECTEADLSEVVTVILDNQLFEIAPNPHDVGKARQREIWKHKRAERAKHLIWC